MKVKPIYTCFLFTCFVPCKLCCCILMAPSPPPTQTHHDATPPNETIFMEKSQAIGLNVVQDAMQNMHGLYEVYFNVIGGYY